MAYARARWKGDAIARSQGMQMAIDPGIRSSLDHEDKLLRCTFRMREGTVSARRKANVVDAKASQTEMAPQ